MWLVRVCKSNHISLTISSKCVRQNGSWFDFPPNHLYWTVLCAKWLSLSMSRWPCVYQDSSLFSRVNLVHCGMFIQVPRAYYYASTTLVIWLGSWRFQIPSLSVIRIVGERCPIRTVRARAIVVWFTNRTDLKDTWIMIHSFIIHVHYSWWIMPRVAPRTGCILFWEQCLTRITTITVRLWWHMVY